MHDRVQFFYEKKHPLSCFSWFCGMCIFGMANMRTRHGQKGTKSLTHKMLCNWHSVTAMPFWVTFGSSCAKQNSCCLVFLIFFACSTCTVGHKIMTKWKIAKHTQYYIFFHTKTLQNSRIVIICQRKQTSLILEMWMYKNQWFSTTDHACHDQAFDRF